MNESQRKALKEQIAHLINCGLSDTEIYGELGPVLDDEAENIEQKIIYPADLIAVIRDLMTAKQD
jgi:hypothetical protein